MLKLQQPIKSLILYALMGAHTPFQSSFTTNLFYANLAIISFHKISFPWGNLFQQFTHFVSTPHFVSVPSKAIMVFSHELHKVYSMNFFQSLHAMIWHLKPLMSLIWKSIYSHKISQTHVHHCTLVRVHSFYLNFLPFRECDSKERFKSHTLSLYFFMFIQCMI